MTSFPPETRPEHWRAALGNVALAFNGSANRVIDAGILDSARLLYEADRSGVKALLSDVDLSGWS